MATTLADEPRRTAPAGQQAGREFPVLFHLMDVSRPRVLPPASDPSVPPEPPHTAVVAPTPIATEPAGPSAPPSGLIESQQLPQGGTSARVDVPLAKSVAAALSASASTATEASPSTAKDEPLQAAISPVARPNAVSDNPIAQESATKRPSQRPSATPPARQRNDWFSNQGKYIAIGFVLALVGTIYLARSNRGSGPLTVAQPTVHPGEAGQQIVKDDAKHATVVGKSKETSPVDTTAGSAVETSPAHLTENSSSQGQPAADLHPPTIPQLVREPTATGQPDSSGLFPWSEQPGNRIATRPAGPQSVAPPQAQPKYPVTPANAPLSNSYPMTSAANSGFVPAPQAPAPAPAVPDYRSPYIPAPPAGQPPTSGQSFVPAGETAPYMPSDNTARGYRYERTGPGPY